jgi:hypothetical protein
MRLCPSVEGSGSPLITHRIGADVCLARQGAHFHKCHRCVYRGQAADWEPAAAVSPLPVVELLPAEPVAAPPTTKSPTTRPPAAKPAVKKAPRKAQPVAAKGAKGKVAAKSTAGAAVEAAL